jgi:hypothetical protein
VFEARVRALLKEVPDMPSTVLAERVGWTGSIRWFRDNVKRLRPEHRPIDPADRIVWACVPPAWVAVSAAAVASVTVK